ncbi:MAG TPA: helix-turn-helix transcriptional regulator [Nitrospira sp.]|nr:helix-turn-helix transcriptional regulator [Nitrospira sp.]
MSEGIGARLRRIRAEWGLSLRDVEERSLLLANESGDLGFHISASWLARIEREGHELTASKVVVLAAIYNLTYEDLLGSRRHLQKTMIGSHRSFEPKATLLLEKEINADTAAPLQQEAMTTTSPPEHTSFLPNPYNCSSSHLRHAVVGRKDRSLDPMIKAGSILQVNTQKRAIAPRRFWASEFDRPIYLLMSHEGYASGWCELDKDSSWLILVPHPLSRVGTQRWRFNKEVEVVGRVSAIQMQLDS